MEKLAATKNLYPNPDREFISGLSSHLLKAMSSFVDQFPGDSGSVFDLFMALHVFYCSIITHVEKQDAITPSEADKRRQVLLQVLERAVGAIGYAHIPSPSSTEHPMIGKFVTIIGTESNGLLDSNGLVCEVIDVIEPPEDEVIYLVRLPTGSMGELLKDDFEFVQIGDNRE